MAKQVLVILGIKMANLCRKVFKPLGSYTRVLLYRTYGAFTAFKCITNEVVRNLFRPFLLTCKVKPSKTDPVTISNEARGGGGGDP